MISCQKNAPETIPTASPRESAVIPVATAPPELYKYLPAAGISWALQLRPQALAADAKLMDEWSRLFPVNRRLAFRRATGFFAEKVSDLWIAGYPLGTLYLFDARASGDDFENAFRKRAMNLMRQSQPEAEMVHLTALVENVPHALLHLKGSWAALAVGDVTLVRLVRAHAEGRLRSSPSAFGSRFLRPFRDFEQTAPARVFFVGPYEQASDAVVGGFVSGAVAWRHQGRELRAKMAALGVWPQEPSTGSSIDRWLAQLLSTRELRALGLGFPTQWPQANCRPAVDENFDDFVHCSAAGAWGSQHLADAAYRLTAASSQELLAALPLDEWRSAVFSGPAPAKENDSETVPSAPDPLSE